MRFGLRIPSYAWPDLAYEDMAQLLDYCRRVEDGPYEDIWVIDHLLVSKGVYGVAWIDPMVMLSARGGADHRSPPTWGEHPRGRAAGRVRPRGG